jgi:hypothetical protein
MKLEESNTNITRTQELEKKIKEKRLLIGKIRHEGTYMSWYYCLRSINVLLAVIMIHERTPYGSPPSATT